MIKDKEKEEKEIEEKKEEKKKEESWFQRVPAIWKVLAAAVIFVRYLAISNSGGNIQELWLWIIGALVILYLIGSESMKKSSGLLTPEEAEQALKKEIARKKRDGQIPLNTKIDIGCNNGLFWHEGMPQHYQIQLAFTYKNLKEFKKGLVWAYGEAKGMVTIQDNMGKLTGRESVPVVSPLPPWIRRSRRYNLDIEKGLFDLAKK